MVEYEVLVTDDTVPESTGIEERELEEVGATIRPIKANTEKDLFDKAINCSAILAKNNPPVTRKVLNSLERCRIIARAGSGVDSINVCAARENDIFVTNVKSYCEDEVSDHTLALIFACLRKITKLDREVNRGNWDRNLIKPVHRLSELTLGLVGLGKISRQVAEKSTSFGFRLVGFDPYVSDSEFLRTGVEEVAWKKLLEVSDVISIHAPLTSETRHMFGRQEFRHMKDFAYIVNTSRGKIIDEEALVYALEKGLISGAGLDVLEDEPTETSPLFDLENVTITPHVAWYSEEAERECRQKASREIRRVLTGKDPHNPLSS